MKENKAQEIRKGFVRDVIEKYKGDGTLQGLALSANQHGIPTSRQALHNWYIGKHLPNKSLLSLYMRILKEQEGSEANRLLEMYTDLYKAAGHYEK